MGNKKQDRLYSECYLIVKVCFKRCMCPVIVLLALSCPASPDLFNKIAVCSLLSS